MLTFFVKLIFLHLLEEYENRQDCDGYRIAENNENVGYSSVHITRDQCALELYGVDKGKGVSDGIEAVTDELKVEPHSR